MGFPITDEQLATVDEIGQLADEQFAPIAERFDRENRFPSENFVTLRERGLLRMPIAEQYGGLGKGIHHDPLPWILAIERLSRACGNTGQTFQIWGHCISMIEELGTPEQVRRLTAEALDGAIICSGGSEPASYTQVRGAQPALGSGTTVEAVEGGYRVNGRKLFISNSGAADVFFIFAGLRQPDGTTAGLVHPILRKGQPGLRVEYDWDAMGMRGTAGDSIVMEDVFVPAEDVIALDAPNAYYRSTLAGAFLTGRSAVYQGIARAALDWAERYLIDRVGAGKDPVMQFRIGELETLYAASASMLYRSAWQWSEVIQRRFDPARAGAFTTMLHTHVGLAAERITSEVLELCGGRGMLRNAPLERYHRDIRAYTVSPPTRNNAMLNAGARVLSPGDAQPRDLVKEGT